MLSVLVNKDKIVVGASAAIFGVLGAFTAYLMINWQALERFGQVRSQICCIIGILVFFSFFMSFGPNVDFIGHLGGLIGGLLISLAVLPCL